MVFSREPDGFDYQGTVIRPPSEAFSILIQTTLGCSHNKCSFCGTYKGKRFAIKDEETILRDLEFARKHCRRQDRVFFMDGDAMIIPQKRLVRLLDLVKEYLPWVTRVGVYANSKSVRLKSDEDLADLKARGLGIAYYGVESGDDETLRRINKGSDAAGLIEQGRRLMKAGIKLSVTVLLGIGGRERWLEHAQGTGRLLTELDPDFVGALTVMVLPGTPLAAEQAAGRFTLPTPEESLMELREMVANTHMTRGMFFSNHASNYLPLRIRYPHGRDEALQVIDRALAGKIGLKPEYLRGL